MNCEIGVFDEISALDSLEATMSWFHSLVGRITRRKTDTDEELRQLMQALEAAATMSEAEQHRQLAKLKDFVNRHPERVDELQDLSKRKREECHVKRQEILQDDSCTVDVSRVAQDLRKQIGWPPTGSVRDLDGGTPPIKWAIEEIDSHGGILTAAEATRVIAALDEESAEAAFVRWEAKAVQNPPHD